MESEVGLAMESVAGLAMESEVGLAMDSVAAGQAVSVYLADSAVASCHPQVVSVSSVSRVALVPRQKTKCRGRG